MEPIREGAELVPPNEPTAMSSCEPAKRRMYWHHVPQVDGVWAPAVHANCVHNELAGLTWRTLGETPDDPGSPELGAEFRTFRRLVRRANIHRVDYFDVIKRYSGAMREKYTRAWESLILDPEFTKADYRLSSFVKGEKVNPLKRAPTKPRMIMARSARFNLELARYLHPVEAFLWRVLVNQCPGMPKLRQVGKGLGPIARAELIRRKREAIGEGAVVFEVDGKRFEAHVTKRDLYREHGVYLAAHSNDKKLRSLLKHQLELRGRTLCGTRFYREGCRASGDYNTGLGNSLIMLAVCRAVMKIYQQSRPCRYDLLVDGDNCLFFVEGKEASLVRSQFGTLVSRVSSQEMEVEKPETTFERCVFGQSQPVFNGKHYVMVRDFHKQLSCAFSGYKHYADRRHGLRVLKAIAQGELYLAIGLPVLQDYYKRAVELLADIPDYRDPTPYLEGHVLEAVKLAGHWDIIQQVRTVRVSEAARVSFEAAFGVSSVEQKVLENRLIRDMSFVDVIGPESWEAIPTFDYPEGDVLSVADARYLSRA